MSKYQHQNVTQLIETTRFTYLERPGTRFYFADGRYITVWDDGAIRLVSEADAPDWELSKGYVNQSNKPGGRCWEGGAAAT